MALHTELPIHRTGVRLLDLAIKAQVQMPRTVKRALGEKITQHCVEIYRPRSSAPPRGYYGPRRAVLNRNAGYTGPLLFGQYHRISKVSPGGVWTLFITGRKRGTWGFQVNGKRPDLSEDGERPTTLGQALGKDAPAPILFIHPKTQEAMELVPEDEAEAILLAKGLIKPEQAEASQVKNLQQLEEELQGLQKEITHKTERSAHTELFNTTLQAIHKTPTAKAKTLLTSEALRAWLHAELEMNGDLWPAHPLLWRPKLEPAARLETITEGDRIHRSAKELIDLADSLGKVVTIERTPLHPLAMGHADYEVHVREKRVRS